MTEPAAMTLMKFIWEKSPEPVSYPDAITRMEQTVEDIKTGRGPERVWLLEHPPLFTAGTSAKAADLFNPHGYPTYSAGRGGQWTYHGPGQRVGYVMLDLTRPRGILRPRDLRHYVFCLEEWIIRTLARFGISGERRDGRIGIWTVNPHDGSEEKIAAIGVRITRWVCWHGIAINLSPSLDDFRGIVPCGIREFGVTSFRKLGLNTTMDELDHALKEIWPEVFGP